MKVEVEVVLSSTCFSAPLSPGPELDPESFSLFNLLSVTEASLVASNRENKKSQCRRVAGLPSLFTGAEHSVKGDAATLSRTVVALARAGSAERRRVESVGFVGCVRCVVASILGFECVRRTWSALSCSAACFVPNLSTI